MRPATSFSTRGVKARSAYRQSIKYSIPPIDLGTPSVIRFFRRNKKSVDQTDEGKHRGTPTTPIRFPPFLLPSKHPKPLINQALDATATPAVRGHSNCVWSNWSTNWSTPITVFAKWSNWSTANPQILRVLFVTQLDESVFFDNPVSFD